MNQQTEYNSDLFEHEVSLITNEIREILIRKNLSYGDSVLNPIRVFSKSPTDEQINVRLDDKLSRIARGEEYPGDDTLIDIVGYLVMKIIKHRRDTLQHTLTQSCQQDVTPIVDMNRPVFFSSQEEFVKHLLS